MPIGVYELATKSKYKHKKERKKHDLDLSHKILKR